MNKNTFKTGKISLFWVICAVLYCSILIGFLVNTLNEKFLYAQPNFIYNPIFSYITALNYILIIAISFVIWIISTFLFHLFALLFDGNARFRDLQKLTGLSYLISAIFIFIAILKIDNLVITKSNINNLHNNSTFSTISHLINFAGYSYYIILIPIVKYLYNINWIKAIGSIIIPLGSVFLLGQFFTKFIL